MDRYKKYREKNSKRRAIKALEWRLLNPEKVEKFQQERKIRVLTKYGPNGTMQCSWLGCSVIDPDMLSIDHVNNDGAKDRKSIGTGNSLYRYLDKNSPRGFQTLCHNHQWKKEFDRRRNLRIERALEKAKSLGLNLKSDSGAKPLT